VNGACDISPEDWERELKRPGLPDHLTRHLVTMAELNRAGRYDRMADGVERVTFEEKWQSTRSGSQVAPSLLSANAEYLSTCVMLGQTRTYEGRSRPLCGSLAVNAGQCDRAHPDFNGEPGGGLRYRKIGMESVCSVTPIRGALIAGGQRPGSLQVESSFVFCADLVIRQAGGVYMGAETIFPKTKMPKRLRRRIRFRWSAGAGRRPRLARAAYPGRCAETSF
jgi:hypothetical protein